MTTRRFDFKTKGVRLAREAEIGVQDSAFLKKICAGCAKPFNKSKGRARVLAITLPGNRHGFFCERCQVNISNSEPGYITGPS
jgi:hypothetical protein